MDFTHQYEVKLPLEVVIDNLIIGDIILCGTYYSPLSILIRKLTKSRYSHAEIYCGDGYSIGAHFNGIKKIPLKKQVNFLKYFIFLRPIEIESWKRNKAVSIAENLIGKGYDFIHLFQYLWRIYLGTLGKAPMPDDPSAHVCFELVAYVWDKAGVKVAGEYPDNAIGRYFTTNPKLKNVFDYEKYSEIKSILQ